MTSFCKLVAYGRLRGGGGEHLDEIIVVSSLWDDAHNMSGHFKKLNCRSYLSSGLHVAEH